MLEANKPTEVRIQQGNFVPDFLGVLLSRRSEQDRISDARSEKALDGTIIITSRIATREGILRSLRSVLGDKLVVIEEVAQ